MRKAGVYLIYAAVALRGLVRLANEPGFGLAAVLLAMFGLLLVLAETRIVRRGPWRFSQAEHSGLALRHGGEPTQGEPWLPLVYLLLQSGLVVGLLFVPPILDFFGLLFIPLSLQAVFFFGRRLGLLCIALFNLAMLGPMLVDEKGWIFGLTMTVLNTGYCLLFSGYAHQVQKSRNGAQAQPAHTRRVAGRPPAAPGLCRAGGGTGRRAGTQPAGARVARLGHPDGFQHEPDRAKRAPAAGKRTGAGSPANSNGWRNWPPAPWARSRPWSPSCAPGRWPRKGCQRPCAGWRPSGRRAMGCR